MSALFDIGSYIAAKFSDIAASGTAGGAGDNTEVDGAYVQVPDDAQSAVMLIVWEAVLADTESLALTANAQHASDASGTGVADFKATAALGADGAGKQSLSVVTVVTNSGGGTERGVTAVRFPDIRSHAGFLRSQVLANLSASGTDTFEYGVVWVFGGMETLPPAAATWVNP